MKAMTDCEYVKTQTIPEEGFEDFLHHVSDCKDCQRRIAAQIVVDFKQRQMERD